MKIEDVKITADTKQTPELNEDGTPKLPVVTPTQPEEDNQDGQEEDLDEEQVDDEQEDEGEDEEEDENPNPAVDPKITPVDTPVDYKKKFGDSTRRNQIVESQFRELQKVLGDITKQEIPSDDEMRATDPDWDYRSDFEKNLSIKIVVQEKRQNHILNTIGSITKESELAESIYTFIENTPLLKGKDAEFYDFVTTPKNKGASMDVLLGAFLHKEGIASTAPESDTTKRKAPSLARSTPTGGNNQKKIEGKYSDEEITHLRLKNPKEYFKLIRQGKLRDK